LRWYQQNKTQQLSSGTLTTHFFLFQENQQSQIEDSRIIAAISDPAELAGLAVAAFEGLFFANLFWEHPALLRSDPVNLLLCASMVLVYVEKDFGELLLLKLTQNQERILERILASRCTSPISSCLFSAQTANALMPPADWILKEKPPI